MANRTFNGKRFRLLKQHLTKTEAQQEKNNYLNKGKNVRVVRETGFYDNKYSVYVR